MHRKGLFVAPGRRAGVREGAAHREVARDDATTRYQVVRAFRWRPPNRRAGDTRAAQRLSLDEAHHRRGREFATVVSDLDRQRVVDVLDGRSHRAVERYLRSRPERERIEVVSAKRLETAPESS